MSVQIMVGDARAMLATMADESVHTCICSPPYWGLRAYLPDGHADKALEIGLEASLAEHIQAIVALFREVRRVLRKDGTVWMNYGDAYAAGGNGGHAKSDTFHGHDARDGDQTGKRKKPSGGLKAKDRMMLPARVAIALCDDGWFLRDEICWHKPNPMPSSVQDRTTPAHEMIYLLSKSRRYFYDAIAIAEPASYSPANTKFPDNWDTSVGNGGHGNILRTGREKGRKNEAMVVRPDGADGRTKAGFNDRWDAGEATRVATRNKRSVWTVATEPFPDAHFATFPTELVKPMVLAGCPARCCARCGAPWVRNVKAEFVPQQDVSEAKGVRGAEDQKPMDASNQWDGFPRGTTVTETTGFSPSCKCDADTVPGTVLDPFLGSGTTALVADRLARNCIGIELNPEYAEMARRRITGDLPLFAEVAAQ